MKRPSDIYLLSDVHIGVTRDHKETAKQERLIAFLRSLEGRAEVFYINGDLFDFWFEYRSVIPKRGAKVLFQLHRLIESGTEVVYVAGNHDFWIDSYLSDEVGMRLCRTAVDAIHQGLRLYVAHGDGLCESDVGYRMLKAVLRNPVCIHLFRLLHPDLGALAARWVSGSGYNFKWWHSNGEVERLYLDAAREKFEEGFDVVAFGHLHRPLLRQVGGKTMVVLGDWIEHFTYAVIREGRVELRRWGEGG